MYIIECGMVGSLGNVSFFGSVLFTPLMIIIVSPLLRIKVLDALDLCAPSECVMLLFMKVRCLIDGCCYGRVLYEKGDNVYRFPSQIVEAVFAVILMYVLIRILIQGKWNGMIYPWYLFIYGIGKFLLNFLRGNLEPLFWFIPGGHFWGVVSAIIGSIFLVQHRKKELLREAHNLEMHAKQKTISGKSKKRSKRKK